MGGSTVGGDQSRADNREDEFFPDLSGREPCQSLLEAASWRLTAELVRRYPDRFSVIETHPGGGQYDCITLVDKDKNSNLSRIEINRAGSIRVHRRDRSSWRWRDCWQELVTANNLRPQLDRLCAQAGLPPVSAPIDHPPRSTRPVVAYRMIAAFMAHQVFSGAGWQCLNGCLDSSGMDGGVQDQFFDAFPAARERMTNSLALFDEEAAYGFWFLVKDHEPRLAIEPEQGAAWTSDGRKSDLFARYQRTHRIWPIVWAVAGHLMP